MSKTDDTHLPLVVGIGGTTKAGSSTEVALDIALSDLPHYLKDGVVHDSKEVRAFVSSIREAKGLIIASPGYHGTISGLVKNAIDYIEETSKDERVYLDGVGVGLIATAYGWQATGSTLAAMRSIVHALRGWPTPLGAGINSSGGIFKNGKCIDAGAAKQLEILGQQVVEFAKQRP